MTAPIIPADQWPDTAAAHIWDEDGAGNWLQTDLEVWHTFPSYIPMPPGHDWRVPVIRPQPAPAIDLEQFRELVTAGIDALNMSAFGNIYTARSLRCFKRLLALIDGQASPHPEGTPMMPAGRFYDGCWRLAPEEVRHHARMLTQSWRAADSSELKRALEAGVLALIDGQAERHPDDIAVDSFAAAMKTKLAAARARGRAGWNGDEPGMQQRLSSMLREHVNKGDPVDVANFAMFLHQRGEGIEQPIKGEGNTTVADTLRTLLAERNHRTDGSPQELADRCLHLSRGDRDLIAMRGSLIDKLQPTKGEGE